MPDFVHESIFRTHRSDYRAWKKAQLRACARALIAQDQGRVVTIEGVCQAARDEYAAADATANGLLVQLVEFARVKGVG